MMNKSSENVQQQIVTAFYVSVIMKNLAIQTLLSERTIQKYQWNFHLHETLYPPKTKMDWPLKLNSSIENVDGNWERLMILLTNDIEIDQVSQETLYNESMRYAVLSFQWIWHQTQSEDY